jgi:hypothetical protein
MCWKSNEQKELGQNEFLEDISTDLTPLPSESLVVTCLAACHSLTIINEELTG